MVMESLLLESWETEKQQTFFIQLQAPLKSNEQIAYHQVEFEHKLRVTRGILLGIPTDFDSTSVLEIIGNEALWH